MILALVIWISRALHSRALAENLTLVIGAVPLSACLLSRLLSTFFFLFRYAIWTLKYNNINNICKTINFSFSYTIRVAISKSGGSATLHSQYWLGPETKSSGRYRTPELKIGTNTRAGSMPWRRSRTLSTFHFGRCTCDQISLDEKVYYLYMKFY